MVALEASPADAKSWNHCPYLIFHGGLYGSTFEYAGSELCLVEIGPGRPYAFVYTCQGFCGEKLEVQPCSSQLSHMGSIEQEGEGYKRGLRTSLILK